MVGVIDITIEPVQRTAQAQAIGRTGHWGEWLRKVRGHQIRLLAAIYDAALARDVRGTFEKGDPLMKDLKKRNILRTVLFFCALSLSLAATSSAQPQGTCSTASVQGTWGFTDTGTVILPTGPVPFAAVGIITGDAHGNFSGTQTTSVGGRVSKETFKGIGTVNSDCTGTAAFSVCDESGTTLLRTATFSVVFVDNAREEREIATSLVLEPSGTPVPTVITGSAKKMFPNSDNEQ